MSMTKVMGEKILIPLHKGVEELLIENANRAGLTKTDYARNLIYMGMFGTSDIDSIKIFVTKKQEIGNEKRS